jgi:predicted short-subunit dehydrogenase-like oxidoreductase (DUF2520 family)
MISSVILLGSGNVASNLLLAFQKASIKINGVWSRNEQHAASFAELAAAPLIEPQNITSQNADLVIVCVSDSAILSLIQKIPEDVKVVHTSGSFDNSSIESETRGVFYPLQTFTKGRIIELDDVPFLVESSNKQFEDELVDFALRLSTTVRRSTSDYRQKLHLSAVWINNFVNHLILKSEELAETNGVDFKLLEPLLRETVKKALDLGAQNAQTGPAIRKDEVTIQKHLERMNKADQELYLAITKSIISTHEK